jgi:hypothetical protein
MLIRETRMSKGRNCQPGCETHNKLREHEDRKAMEETVRGAGRVGADEAGQQWPCEASTTLG